MADITLQYACSYKMRRMIMNTNDAGGVYPVAPRTLDLYKGLSLSHVRQNVDQRLRTGSVLS